MLADLDENHDDLDENHDDLDENHADLDENHADLDLDENHDDQVSGDRCVPQIAFRQIMQFDYNAKPDVNYLRRKT